MGGQAGCCGGERRGGTCENGELLLLEAAWARPPSATSGCKSSAEQRGRCLGSRWRHLSRKSFVSAEMPGGIGGGSFDEAM